MISSYPVSAVGGTSTPAVISSFSADVSTPSPCPLRNLTSTPESYQVTLSDSSPSGNEGIKGNRSRNSSPAMSRKSSVVSPSGRPCEQLEVSSTQSGQPAPFDDAGKAVVLDDASGHWEAGELAVISTCRLKNVSDAPAGVSVCCGTTGCTESGLKSVVVHGSADGLAPDECGTSRNVFPRERSEPCFPAVGGTSESALMSSRLLRNTSNTPESYGVSHGTVTRESVTSSFSAVVTVPSTCPLKNTTNTHGSSGELHGTITDTHTAQRKSSSALPVSFVPSGVELVSRNTYINSKKRNRETCWRQSKALKRVQREAKRKLVAQPEISHAAAEAILRSQAPRTDENFRGIIHVSHQLALLHGHENVFFCTQFGAVNAGGSLRLLKSLCDGSGESRQEARRKIERGLMPNEHVVADAKRAF